MRLVIDPGHGGHETGAVFGAYKGLIYKEKDINLRVSLFLFRQLSDLNIMDICMTRDEDRPVTLRERCRIANNFKANYFLSVHCNADPDPDLPGMPQAKGEEIWYYSGSTKGAMYAAIIADLVDKVMPDEKFRGIKDTKNFTVLKYTNMPANLIELGFIDNSTSVRRLSDPSVQAEIAGFLMLGTLKIQRYIDAPHFIDAQHPVDAQH